MSLCSPHNNKLFVIFMSFGQRKSLSPNKIEYIVHQKYWLSSLSFELRKGLPVCDRFIKMTDPYDKQLVKLL